MSTFKNLTNQKFGRLIVLSLVKRGSKNKHAIWLCKCNCGNLTEVRSDGLLGGDTKSCGCFWKEKMASFKSNFKHGEAIHGKQTPLYKTWRGMKDRCLNPNSCSYKWYGKRGISICGEWKDDYLIFKNWALKNGHKKHLTIDRIDNNGNYEPLNCQWITGSENTRKANVSRRSI